MIIDCHIHMLGNGLNGSGCRLALTKPYHRLLARIMLHSYQLPVKALTGDLETLWVERLLAWIRESSVDRVMLLAHEDPYDSSGRIIPNFGSLFVPNDLVVTLAQRHSEFIPAISLHPARVDALSELERLAGLGAKAIKLLPNCQNVDCSLEQYREFWQSVAKHKLIFLAHTGGELSLPVYNKQFADPRILRLPLECGVRTIAAHCGTNSLVFDPDYTDIFLGMLNEYPHLYGDCSGMLSPFRSKHFEKLLRSGLSARILHGSDLPIPNSPLWLMLRGLISNRDRQTLAAINNPVERDYQIKRKLGFPEESFTTLGRILYS